MSLSLQLSLCCVFFVIFFSFFQFRRFHDDDVYRRRQFTVPYIIGSSESRSITNKGSNLSHGDTSILILNKFSNVDYPWIPFGYRYRVILYPKILHHTSTFLFVVIISRPSHIQQRELIRQYYQKQQQTFNMTYMFAMGTSRNDDISREAFLYNDILQFDHVDCYHNLTLTVLHSLQVIDKSSVSYVYVLKTDDDSVVNFRVLFSIIETPSIRHMKYIYLGNCYNRAVYNTDNRTALNYVPEELIKSDRLIPHYATGAGYIMSYRLVSAVNLEASRLSFVTHQEDVTIGRAIHRAGLNCLAPRPGRWVARHGCIGQSDCRSYVIVHVSSDYEELKRVYAEF